MFKKIILIIIVFLTLTAGTAYASTDISISHIDISPKKIFEGDTAQITIDIGVETPEDESKVTLSLYIDGSLEKKVTRYYSEKTQSYTFTYDTEDLEIGIHTTEIITRIYRGTSIVKAEDSLSKKFEIHEKKPQLDLTMNIYPKQTEINRKIQIFGYVDPTDEIIEIHVDGMPKKTTIADINGYYSTFVKITKTGDHVITTIVGASKTHKIVNIIEPAPEKITTTIPTETKKEVIITIIEPVKPVEIETIETTKTDTIDDTKTDTEKKTEETETEQTEFNYITVETSNKEIDVNQFESNLVRLTITNNENRSHLFSIDSDFSEQIIYLPEDEIILAGKTKIMPIYFSVDEKPGRYYGILYVRNEERIVKEIPLSVFVSENDEITKNITTVPFFSPINTELALLIITLFAITIIMVLANKVTKKMIKPLELSDMERPTANILKKIHNDIQQNKTMKTTRAQAGNEIAYLVPWNNIVL